MGENLAILINFSQKKAENSPDLTQTMLIGSLGIRGDRFILISKANAIRPYRRFLEDRIFVEYKGDRITVCRKYRGLFMRFFKKKRQLFLVLSAM